MNELKVFQPARRISKELIEALGRLPVANVSDVMARLDAAGPRLRPYHRAGNLAGPAFTVKTRPGDNLMIHKALDMAQAGDVIVVDAGGDLTNALIGEMMLMQAERRGLAGIALDGAIRDLAHVRAHDFPVYAAGVTHRGPYKNGPGAINVPVSLGGMVIEPGDAILGDEDGLVCVPFEDAESVLGDATQKAEAERRQVNAIMAGTNDRTWVDRALAECGFPLRTE